MPELLLASVLSVALGAVFLTIFPTFHTLLNSVDTTGMLPLVVFLVKSMPYWLCFLPVYGVILMFKNRGRV